MLFIAKTAGIIMESWNVHENRAKTAGIIMESWNVHENRAKAKIILS